MTTFDLRNHAKQAQYEYLDENDIMMLSSYRKQPSHADHTKAIAKTPEMKNLLQSLHQKYGFNKTRFFGHQ